MICEISPGPFIIYTHNKAIIGYFLTHYLFTMIMFRAGEPEPVVAGCFWLLGAGAAWRKKSGAGADWKKKSGAGAAKKLAGCSALREDKKHKEIVF